MLVQAGRVRDETTPASRQNFQTASLCPSLTTCEVPRKLRLQSQAKRRPPESKTARRTQLPGGRWGEICTSATSPKICRDRRVGKTRTPDDELRDSLTGESCPNSIAGSTSPHAPAERHLVSRRRRTTPSKIQKPAEGPSLRPSLALNIDPAPVHALTHITPPPASRTGTNPILLQLQTPTCTSSSQADNLQFLQSGSPLPCTSSSPANPSSVSSTGPGVKSVAHQGRTLHLLKSKEPSPVTRPVQELIICSSSRQRPTVCN